ncbi:hypothetical protein Tco_0334529, partial [Tanacetum coccineum]
LAEASPLVAQTDYAFLNKISEFAPEPLSVILQLEPEKLVFPANVPTSRDAHVSSPIAKESTVTLASESFELFANVVHVSFTIALEQNEEWVNVMVDGPDVEMTDGVAHSKFWGVFIQGTVGSDLHFHFITRTTNQSKKLETRKEREKRKEREMRES